MKHGLAEGSSQSTLRPLHLPPELGFLLGRGFTFNELRQVAIGAAHAGVPADRFILAADIIDETAYYRALALELALPFTDRGRVSQRARFPESILAGLAPLATSAGGFLLAPQGAMLVRLLQHRHLQGGGAVVTTPSALRRAVLEAKAGAISHQASHALPEWRVDLSSRDGWLWRQLAGLCLVLLALVLSMSFGRHTPIIGLAIAASPLFLGMVVTRLAACLLANPPEPAARPRRAKNSELPSYTVIAALYREGAVVHKLIAALCNLDYPREKLDVMIVVEADDRETRAALAAIHLPGHMAVVVAPPGYPRTKPRALNVALPLARGDLTVVYDAEDDPDSYQLRLAAASFAELPPDVGCLQARLTIDNTRDTWLTRMFTVEYAALFDVFNPGLALIGSPILLGGTSNHFRTHTLKAIRGWDAWNVTEDADLGIRLARLGYRVADLPSSTLEEAPSTLAAWMRQRTRWMKGFIQTCIGHSRHPLQTVRHLGVWRAYGAITVTLGPVLSALGYPFFTAFALLLWWDETGAGWSQIWRAFSATLFVLGIAAIYVPAIVALSRRGLWELLPWTLLLPFYYLLISIAAWRGLWELIWTPFRWNKTRHGLARTTRQFPPQKHQARAARTMSLNTAPP
ncbi:MAG: glycosyl transferase [Microvirga sp.]|nr:glycosyl transferase [Microvirga sp.]